MTIYLDELFIINFAADYLLIASAAALSSSPVCRWRFALGALFGAVYALLTVFPEFGFLESPVFRAAAAALMTLTAFGFGTPARFIRRSGVFFITGFAFAGFLELLFRNRYPVPPMLVLIASTAAAYILLTFFLHGSPKVDSAPPPKMQVHVETDNGSIDLCVLGDTGNRLRDPFTGDRVLILSLDACRSLLPEKTAELIKLKGSTAAVVECGGLRLIPYKSLGGDGFLSAIRPRRLTIDGKDAKHTLVAFTCAELAESTGCAGIMSI